MSVRPLTIVLFVVILMGTASYGLYRSGMFDSFLSESSEVGHKGENSGPVVRNAVSDLVLPMTSANPVEEVSLNGTSAVAAGNESVSEATAQDNTVITPSVEPQSVESSQSEHHPAVKKVASLAVTETPKEISQEQPKESTVSSESVSEKKNSAKPVKYGTLSHFKLECSDSSLTVKMSLSEPSGKITWFNLSNPRKLVVDIHGHWKNYAKSIYRLKGCAVQKIILGEQSDRMRIVFYLKKRELPARIKPEIKKSSNKLDIKIDF